MTEPAQSHSRLPSSGDGLGRAPVEAATVNTVAHRAPAGWRACLEALLGRFLPKLAGAFGLRSLSRAPEACLDLMRLRTKRLIRIVPPVADAPLDQALITRMCDREIAARQAADDAVASVLMSFARGAR